jgi:hypothetical protein
VRSRASSRERSAVAAAAVPDRYQRGSDSSRLYDRDRDRQYDRDRELRQDRDRDRERDGRYRSERDRRYDMGGRDGPGGRRRSSRSRSRGRRGQELHERDRDRDRQYKRGRDERDREDSKVGEAGQLCCCDRRDCAWCCWCASGLLHGRDVVAAVLLLCSAHCLHCFLAFQLPGCSTTVLHHQFQTSPRLTLAALTCLLPCPAACLSCTPPRTPAQQLNPTTTAPAPSLLRLGA